MRTYLSPKTQPNSCPAMLTSPLFPQENTGHLLSVLVLSASSLILYCACVHMRLAFAKRRGRATVPKWVSKSPFDWSMKLHHSYILRIGKCLRKPKHYRLGKQRKQCKQRRPHTLQTAQTVQTLQTLQTAQTVQTLQTLQTVQTLQTAQTCKQCKQCKQRKLCKHCKQCKLCKHCKQTNSAISSVNSANTANSTAWYNYIYPYPACAKPRITFIPMH